MGMVRMWRMRGFTIVEMIVVIALTSIVLLGLLMLFTNYYQTYQSQQAVVRTSGSATMTASEIRLDASQASQIVPGYNFSGTYYATDEDTLVLMLPSVDNSGSIVTGIYDYVAFYLDGQKLYKRLETGMGSGRVPVVKLLSDTVSSVTFTYDNPDVSQARRVDVSIFMQAPAGKQSASHSLKESVYLRNK